MKKFGERLRELRNEKGISLKTLASQAGLSATGIAQWERYERVPNLDAVIVLAQYFRVSLDYIAGLED